MRLIDKYIYKEFLTPFFYCFFAFVIIFIIGDLFENLDNFILMKGPKMLIFKYYLFLIPSIFVLTTPLAILLSILYQLGYMSRYNELVALKASGVSFWRVMLPFGFLGVVFGLLLFTVNERMIPDCSRELSYIRELYINKKAVERPREKESIEARNITFFSSLYNVSFYVDKIKGDEAEGLSIREFNTDGSLKKEWYGQKGIWIDSSWWLFDGYIRSYSISGKTNGGMQFFKKQVVSLDIHPSDLLHSKKDAETISNYMDIKELHNYIRRNFSPANLPRELLVDLYEKISIPFTIFIVVIFGVTFGGRISKGGALASVGYSLIFYLAYYGLSSFLLAMGKLGKLLPSLAVWTPHILFGIVSTYLLKKTR